MGFTELSNWILVIFNRLFRMFPLVASENFYVFWDCLVVLYNFALGKNIVGHRSRSSMMTA
jgi:hypothetical protein